MKPDQERIARELAYVVLAGAEGLSGGMPGKAEVMVEMRGMVQTIRRHILIDHANLALRIADEIERQTEAVDFGKIVAEAVAREVRAVRAKVDEIVHREIAGAVERQVRAAAEVAAREIGQRAVDRILAKEAGKR